MRIPRCLHETGNAPSGSDVSGREIGWILDKGSDVSWTCIGVNSIQMSMSAVQILATAKDGRYQPAQRWHWYLIYKAPRLIIFEYLLLLFSFLLCLFLVLKGNKHH